LRVYLGSAPGVGKTYRMLDEGWRRKQRGTDVVIGYVETHKRPLTDAQKRDLEVVPRVTLTYRGTSFEEMDVEAVLARKPEVVLVDELAHTNAPGSLHEKRWQDVEDLLEAGMDVITTVNIQHLESVNDVVEKITGILQQETVPDAVVRRAEQIELVDITPEALRRRMAHGNIYAADKIDASLSNYFRVGNLSALRELALLWLADRVEDALRRYLDDHDITAAWETRERLIVCVSGAAGDEVLLRRAARMVSRTGAELVTVHVVSTDTERRSDVDTSSARALTAEFEGRFQEIVDDDVATALVAFARSERGTQIILGTSRRASWWHPLGGVVGRVLRHSADLDVHVIALDRTPPERPTTRRRRSSVALRRQLIAAAAAVVVLPLVTMALAAARSSLSLSTEFLVYLVVVLALGAAGGVVVGIVAALAAFVLENLYFIPPLHTFTVRRPDNVVSLVAFLVFAVGASLMMQRLSRRSHEAERARAESRVLAQAVTSFGTSHEDLRPLLDSLRAVVDANSVALLARRDGEWRIDVASGEDPVDVTSAERFAIDEDYELALVGAALGGEDRQLISAFTERIAAGLRVVGNVQDAQRLRVVAEAEVAHVELLRTITRELRGSVAEMRERLEAAVDGVATAPPRVQRQRLEDLTSQLDRLERLEGDLVEVTRLDAGEVAVRSLRVTLGDVIDVALGDLATLGHSVDVDVDRAVALTTDPGLLARVVSEAVDSACRATRQVRPVHVRGGRAGDRVEILVIDQNPERTPVPRSASRSRATAERARADDVALFVAAGLTAALGGEMRFEDTPGGGLTVVVNLPDGAEPVGSVPELGQ
jgi:two-component system sensor histidine kinase KdpD